MQILIAVVGLIVTLLVVVGSILMTPRNIERVVHTEAGTVVAPVDDEL